MKYTMGSGIRRGHVWILLCVVLGLTLSASAIMSRADMTDAAAAGDIATVKRLLADGRDINDTYGCQENALHQAVLGEHLELVKFLLSKGININQRSCSGRPMDFALRTGNAKIIRVLWNHSVKPKSGCGELAIQAVLGNTKRFQQLLKQETDEKEFRASSVLVIRAGKPKMLPLFVPGRVPASEFMFLTAASKGDIESAKYLIKHGLSIDKNSRLAREYLSLAIEHKRIPMLRWLLEQKINPAKGPKENQRSPLECALRTGNAEIVDLLIRHGAKLQFKGAEAEKQLYQAVCGGNVKLASRFLSKGVDPNTINPRNAKSQTRLLHLAADANDVPMAKALIKAGSDVHAKNQSGHTPLGDSIGHDDSNIEVIRFLLSAGAKADIPNQIIAAASSQDTELVKLLVKHGADVNAVNPDSDGVKSTPLHHAAALGPKEMITFLLAKGARIHAKDTKGKTPLFWAIDGDSPERIAQLLKAGARITDVDLRGKGLLHHAAQKGSTKSIAYLLSRGADPNARDKKQRTCLHQAILIDGPDSLTSLLAHSKQLDINAVDAEGRTPLHYAAYLHHLAQAFPDNDGDDFLSFRDLSKELRALEPDSNWWNWLDVKERKSMVDALLKRKADPTLQDKHGKTPATWKSAEWEDDPEEEEEE